MTQVAQSPALEDGFTQIANELLEVMCRAGFSARQWAVVMAVVRKTYGYGKKADDISLGQIADMTGIAKPNVSRAVTELVAAKVLLRSAGTFGYRLGVNKRYRQWALEKASSGVADSITGVIDPITPGSVIDSTTGVIDLATHGEVIDSATPVIKSITGYQNDNGGYQIDHAGVIDLATTKEHSTKERKTSMSGKPDQTAALDHLNALAWEAIQLLNARCGTGYQRVEANLKLVRARLSEGATMEDVRAVIDAKAKQWNSDKKMREYLRPATLFNATKFNQYVGQIGAATTASDGDRNPDGSLQVVL